jgi:hypothetical protein
MYLGLLESPFHTLYQVMDANGFRARLNLISGMSNSKRHEKVHKVQGRAQRSCNFPAEKRTIGHLKQFR